jgi:hypothetical protein
MAQQQSLEGPVTKDATVQADGTRGTWKVVAPARSSDPDDPAGFQPSVYYPAGPASPVKAPGRFRSI